MGSELVAQARGEQSVDARGAIGFLYHMPADPTLRQLSCLCALAETRSFRRAAERIGVSQPSFSAQIKALEAALDLTLVERRSSGAELTPVGRDVLDRARGVLEAARDLRDFARVAQKRLSGRIRLGVSPTVGPYLLPQVVGRLHRGHPDLRLFIREAPPADLGRELVEGAHDAVLVQLPVTTDGVVVEELYRERLLLIVAADHPLATFDAAPPDRLAGLEVLTLDARYQLHEQAARLCESYGARLLSDYEGGSLDALRLMVAAGAGIAFAPELYVRSEVRPGGDVAARPIRGRALNRRIGLAWRRSFRETEALRLLGDIARDAFQRLSAGPLPR
jgi:LysR family hydrogen peroxide-inducible transcriptional activator